MQGNKVVSRLCTQWTGCKCKPAGRLVAILLEFEQGSEVRAAYDKKLLPRLAESLKGFDASNLCYMRLFYEAFLMCDALRHALSWTDYWVLLRVSCKKKVEEKE